jgi:NADPH:quinone reductase-like Zn-dependent oxidoreductase
MRALFVPAAGEQPQLGELPTPTATEGTVLVRVKAVGLNALDNAIAAGMLAEMLPHEYPLVLGRDAAGVVEAVGAGVEGINVGDEVLGHVAFAPPIQAGTLAEHALLSGETVVVKPANLDFTAAAAIPLAGAAAARAVDAVQPESGHTVLVNGADGGVGSYVVQLLAARGVHVIATCTPDTADRVRSLGASNVVDYTSTNVVDAVRAAHPEGVDALVNVAGFDPAAVPVGAVREGGALSSTTVEPDADVLAAAGVTSTAIMAQPTREILAPLVEQAAAGSLKVDIAGVVALDQALEGLATLAAGRSNGKLVVKVQD